MVVVTVEHIDRLCLSALGAQENGHKELLARGIFHCLLRITTKDYCKMWKIASLRPPSTPTP